MSNMWGWAYRSIINSNKILEKAQEGESKEMDQLIGENYFLRGWLEFVLVNVFGRPYNQSPETNLGIPLKLTADINDYPMRSTVKESYEQILKDLKKAEALLNSESNIYAGPSAAKALLSRVYLYMGNNKLAAEYATEVIESSGRTLLEGEAYATANVLVPEDNPEIIFAIRCTKDKDDYGWNSIGGFYANIDGVGWGELYASEPLRDAYAEYPEDLRSRYIVPQYLKDDETGEYRKEFIYIESSEEDGVPRKYYRWNEIIEENGNYRIKDAYLSKYEYKDTLTMKQDAGGYYVESRLKSGKDNPTPGTYEKHYVTIQNLMAKRNDYPKYYVYKCSKQENQPQLWSPTVLRLGEMYLNRAEAYAKEPALGDALADLNVIRTRAHIPALSASDMKPGKTMLEYVLEERRKELAFEGHRRFDIFRNGLTMNRTYPGTHDRGAATSVRLTISADDPAAIEFIPQREIDSYPGVLEQNP